MKQLFRFYQAKPVQYGESPRGKWAKQTILFKYLSDEDGYIIPMTVFGEASIGNIQKQGLKERDFVLVDFHLEGREWEGKWYPDIILKSVVKYQSAPQVDATKLQELSQVEEGGAQ